MKRILYIIVSMMFLASFIICIQIKFSNPDMTDMRLILTYWKIYLLNIAAGLVWCWLRYIQKRW
jgi:hypothetical protein